MSKKVKSLMEKEFASTFAGVESVAVLSPSGVDGVKNNQLRRKLREKGLRMKVVKNNLARRAAENTKLKGFDKLLDGPSAVIFGNASISSIARLLIEAKKNDEKLDIRGIFFDGEIYPGEKGVEQVSKFPTREGAIATISPAPSKVPADVLAPSSNPSRKKPPRPNQRLPRRRRARTTIRQLPMPRSG
jgi:large subunit ribosomal protein L10